MCHMHADESVLNNVEIVLFYFSLMLFLRGFTGRGFFTNEDFRGPDFFSMLGLRDFTEEGFFISEDFRR